MAQHLERARPIEQAYAGVERRRPRVLHLITKLDIGGTERQAVELLKRLDADRYDVRLAVIHGGGPLYREVAARFPRVPEFPLNSLYNLNALRQLKRLRALLVGERIDILHAHDFYAGIFGSVAARLASVPVIASQRHIRLSDRRVHLWGARLTRRLARRVLVNSEAIRAAITADHRAREEKIVVIRNGLRSIEEAGDGSLAARRRRHDELCRELGLDPWSKLVGMVARFHPVKGHRFFIEAAASVSREVESARFVLVGDGPLRQDIKDLAARLSLSDRLRLLGDRTDANQLVAAFDVAVLASLHEGLPNAVMEAMAAGVPVVATAVGGTRELVRDGETGYLVPPADARAMAERVRFALNHEAASAAVAARGREFVMSRYAMERMVESVERLYDELVEESKRKVSA